VTQPQHAIPARRIGAFALQFLPVFALLVALFPWTAPAWRAALRAGATPILAGFRPPTHIAVTPEGAWRYVDVNRAGQELETLFLDHDGLTLQSLNLVLLPALLLATPGAPKRRLARLGLGLALLFALQLAGVVAWGPVGRCLTRRPGDRVCATLFYGMISGGQALSFAIWGLLGWRAWLSGGPGRARWRSARR